MATYEEAPFHQAAYYHPTGAAGLGYKTTDRQLANNDIVKLAKIARETKILDCVIGSDDGNGPSDCDLVVTDGTTTYTLIEGADLSSANAVARLNRPANLGLCMTLENAELQLIVGAAGGAGGSGQVSVGVTMTNVTYGGESSLQPQG